MKRTQIARGISTLKRSQLKRTGKPLRARRDSKLVAWGKAVLERDEWQCQAFRFTGSHEFTSIQCSNVLDPHHLYTRGRRPDKRYEIDAGVCLCRNHHSWIDNNLIEAERIGLVKSESYEAAQKAARS